MKERKENLVLAKRKKVLHPEGIFRYPPRRSVDILRRNPGAGRFLGRSAGLLGKLGNFWSSPNMDRFESIQDAFIVYFFMAQTPFQAPPCHIFHQEFMAGLPSPSFSFLGVILWHYISICCFETRKKCAHFRSAVYLLPFDEKLTREFLLLLPLHLDG